MKRTPGGDTLPTWQDPAPGVRVLRLYQSALNPGWPRIVILDLSHKRFQEFERDPMAFDKKHKIYPEQPIRWFSSGAKPPRGEGISEPPKNARWMVIICHSKPSGIAYAAAAETDS